MSILSLFSRKRDQYAQLDSPKAAKDPKTAKKDANAEAVSKLLEQRQAIRDQWQSTSKAYGELDPKKITEAQKQDFTAFKEKSIKIMAKINEGLKGHGVTIAKVTNIPGLI